MGVIVNSVEDLSSSENVDEVSSTQTGINHGYLREQQQKEIHFAELLLEDLLMQEESCNNDLSISSSEI
jgi:hypothetical protein